MLVETLTEADLQRSGAYLISPEHITWKDVQFVPLNEEPSLEWIYEHIGGSLFENVYIKKGRTICNMLVDEMGKIKSKPVNILATTLHIHGTQDCIVGKAVVLCGAARLR